MSDRTEAIEQSANEFFAQQSLTAERMGVNLSASRMIEAYESHQLIGAALDDDELPMAIRKYARNCQDQFKNDVGASEYLFASARGTGSMYGDYQGKLCIPYRHHLKIDPRMAYVGAQLTGDCFVAGTLVLMGDGSEKPIEDVKIGDSVLSRTGVPRRVLEKIEKPYSGDLVTIEAKGYAESVTSTPDHQFTVMTGTRYPSGDWRPKRTHSNAWQSAEDLADDPILLSAPNIPIRPIVFDIGTIADELRKSRQVSKRSVPLDDSLAWLFGLYLAEGSCEHESGQPIRITFNLGSHETDLIERATSIIRDVFGVEPNVSNLPSKPTVTLVRIPSKPIAVLFSRLFPGNQWSKTVPACLFASPISTRCAAVRGWMDGDGHVRINDSKAIGSRSIQAQGVSASAPLRRSMFRLMLSAGIKPALRIRNQESHQRVASGDVFAYGANALAIYPEHTGSVGTMSKNPELCEWGLMAPIAKKTVDRVENTTVYCLEVEEEHSFIANGYAVHNCVSWAKRTARDQARCFDIDAKGANFEYVLRSATADLYSMRGHTGQGASPSRIAAAATKIGILLEAPATAPDGKVWDFSDYRKYYRWGMDYGRTGLPSWIFDLNRDKGPKQVAVVKTEAELLTALWNGCGVSVGSMIGVSKTGGKDGVSFLSALFGSWAHDMAIVGFDDRKKYHRSTLVIWDQSWGNWQSRDLVRAWPADYGPRPEGAFVLTLADTMKAVRGGECHALSDSIGFRPRRQATLGAEGLI